MGSMIGVCVAVYRVVFVLQCTGVEEGGAKGG